MVSGVRTGSAMLPAGLMMPALQLEATPPVPAMNALQDACCATIGALMSLYSASWRPKNANSVRLSTGDAMISASMPWFLRPAKFWVMNEMAPLAGLTNADGVCRSCTSSMNAVRFTRSLRSIHSERRPASYDQTFSGENGWLATAVVPRAFHPPDLKPRVALANRLTSWLMSYFRATRGVNSLVDCSSGMPRARMFAEVVRVGAVTAGSSGLALAMKLTFLVSSV